jgi:L,D-peptidoglycan transpeptidase YkuD (ErfK/YbiS/YcfS/YnhG family)
LRKDKALIRGYSSESWGWAENKAMGKDRIVRNIVVRPKPGNRSQGLMSVGGRVLVCALGKGGIQALKREGDGGTPLARMRLLSAYVRMDHVAARATLLPMAPITPALGWCEVPGDRNYNRPVRLPYAASHETMNRADPLYDIVIVMDWNIVPRRRTGGSAIFFHVARPGLTPTEGCVALPGDVMRRLLPMLSAKTVLTVRR